MADALATMDASTAKQARTKSVDIVESVEVRPGLACAHAPVGSPLRGDPKALGLARNTFAQHIRRQLHALVDETG